MPEPVQPFRLPFPFRFRFLPSFVLILSLEMRHACAKIIERKDHALHFNPFRFFSYFYHFFFFLFLGFESKCKCFQSCELINCQLHCEKEEYSSFFFTTAASSLLLLRKTIRFMGRWLMLLTRR